MISCEFRDESVEVATAYFPPIARRASIARLTDRKQNIMSTANSRLAFEKPISELEGRLAALEAMPVPTSMPKKKSANCAANWRTPRNAFIAIWCRGKPCKLPGTPSGP